MFALRERYLNPLEEVMRFLQGKNPTFARLICTENYLPRASRFEQLDDMDWAFGSMGMQDKAKHIGTLYLEICLILLWNASTKILALAAMPNA